MATSKAVPLGPLWLRVMVCVVAFAFFLAIVAVSVVYPERWGVCLVAVIIVSPFSVCGFFMVVKGSSPKMSHSMSVKVPGANLSSTFGTDSRSK